VTGCTGCDCACHCVTPLILESRASQSDMRKHHKNIVMDPIGHLAKVDLIVDDISHEIIHRPKHSPFKDKWSAARNIEVMEGFGKRTISVSKSTRDINVDDTEELEVINDHSDWKVKTKMIQRRSRGWMGRLQKDMAQGRVECPDDSGNEDRSSCLTRAGSMRVLTLTAKFTEAERTKKPPRPQLDIYSDLKPFKNNLLKSSLCVVCFDIVGYDFQRLSCAYCPVVAHSFCVTSKPALFPDDKTIAQEEEDRAETTGASEQHWSCPFCIHEVKLGNKHRQEKYFAAVKEHAEKEAILLLQSHVRMYPSRKRYRMLVAAAITVQRFHRSQHLRRALIRDRLTQRRPLRLCIHQVTLFCEVSTVREPVHLPVSNVVTESAGSSSNTRVFCQFGTNHLPRSIANKLADTASVTDISKLPSENLSLKSTNTKLRRRSMLNLLQLGHMMEPQPTISSSVDLKVYPPNSMFLTLTVQRFEHGTDRQLYRDDVPLYPLSDPAMQPKRHEYAGHFKVLEAVSEIVERGAERCVDRGTSGVATLKIYPPRSMVVLPSCPADVTVYLTVSRVTEWPRACIIGQSVLKADHLSIWRQCLCMSQAVSVKNIEEEPKNDSCANRLALFYRPMTARGAPSMGSVLTARGPGTARTISTSRSHDSSWGLPDIGSAQNTSRSRQQNKYAELASKNVIGGQILWSFVSTPPIGNMFGYLHFMTQGSLLSYKKKSWCVLMDGQLLIYTRATDLKPKEVIVMKQCHSSVVEKVIMKIVHAKDSQTWFCTCDFVNKRDMWTEAFKENSLPQVPKHVSITRASTTPAPI